MDELPDITKKGKELLENGEYLEALEYFEQALKLSPNDPDLWNSKGLSLKGMGRYDEANQSFNKSLEIDPRDKHSS